LTSGLNPLICAAQNPFLLVQWGYLKLCVLGLRLLQDGVAIFSR